MPPCQGRRLARFRSARMAREVHDVDGRDGLAAAVFLELEIGGGQAGHGLPVPAGHADGNLDDGYPRALANGARAVVLGEGRAQRAERHEEGCDKPAPAAALHRAAFAPSSFRARPMSAANRPAGAVLTKRASACRPSAASPCSSATTPRFNIASNC